MAVNLTSPQEFFHNQVQSALKSQKVQLNTEVEFYLVNPLCAYIDPMHLTLDDGKYDPLHTPLAILFEKAVEAPLDERLKILKTVGDTSLYMSGFFQDSFHRKTISIDYFITLGSNAYLNASSITRQVRRDIRFSNLYENLAEKFSRIVDIVAHISDELGVPQHKDLLAIYDRWMQCKSDRLFNKLRENGIVPIDFSKSKQ